MKTGYVGLGARIANVSNCLQEVSGDLDPCAYVDPTPAGLKHVEAKCGHSLTAYQQNLRIERARDLLAATTRSVAEIAAEGGYSDLPAFHRVFSRQAGMTPGRFRRTQGSAPSPATPPPAP